MQNSTKKSVLFLYNMKSKEKSIIDTLDMDVYERNVEGELLLSNGPYFAVRVGQEHYNIYELVGK